jgi:hypothetical protein
MGEASLGPAGEHLHTMQAERAANANYKDERTGRFVCEDIVPQGYENPV